MSDASFTVGELLAGKYRVESVIGEGGMGVVLGARHEGLATNVAIKLLRNEALRHPGVVGRFMREARAAVSLKSEHVARVFDVGTLEDGRPYMVMERLEGSDLGAVVESGAPIAIDVAVDYVLQACEAIAEAHATGIVHRDLKPKNLFLTKTVDGRPLVKVLDFGISKMDAATEMQLTSTTDIIGSPSYMSPEQLRSSRDVDVRTDIWSLGVILYELLTLRLPFNAATVTALVLVVATEHQRPLRDLRPDCPEALAAIVERCLQKAPEDRYPTVADLALALEPFASNVQATATERIRRMAGLAPTEPMARPLAPTSAGRTGTSGNGNTAVAWAETVSMEGPAPAPAPEPAQVPAAAPPPKRSRAMLFAIGGVLVVLAGGGAVFALQHRSGPVADAVPTAAPLPLPSGRERSPAARDRDDRRNDASALLDPCPERAARDAHARPAGHDDEACTGSQAFETGFSSYARAPEDPNDLDGIGRN